MEDGKEVGMPSSLALEVTLSDDNELLIEIIDLFVVVALISAGSDYDPLGLTVLAPLLLPLPLLFVPMLASLSGAP
jgi:hypothetical protein